MRYQIIIYLIIFGMGVTVGAYLLFYLENQIFHLAGIIIWLGSGGELLTLLYNWYRTSCRKPKLSIEYDEKNQSTFFPEYIIGQDEESRNIIRKDIMVLIKNKGGVARNCKAYLRLIDKGKSTIAPSGEDKKLLGKESSHKMDIGAIKGRELLHIVFSDSYFEKKGGGYCAFISTEDAFKNPFNRAQEGFGVGDFKVELIVTSEKWGASTESKFKIHVGKNFRELSMKEIK